MPPNASRVAPIAIASFLAIGCGSSSSPRPIARPPPPSSSVSRAPASAPVVEADAGPSPFYLAFEGETTSARAPLLRLFSFGANVIGLFGGDFAPVPIRIDASSAKPDPTIYAGLRGAVDAEGRQFFSISSITGNWPVAARAETNAPGERGGTSTTWTWRRDHWVAEPELHGAAYFRALYAGVVINAGIPWAGGRWLWEGTSERGPELYFDGKRAEKSPFQPAKGTGACATRLTGHRELVVATNGDLFGLGPRCGGSGEALEHWAKGATTSEVHPLPGDAAGARLQLVVYGPTDVLVVGGSDDAEPHLELEPYLVQFDGSRWTDTKPPGHGVVRQFARDPSGGLVALIGDALYRRAGAAWSRLSPEGTRVRWFTRAPDGTLWARLGDQLAKLERATWTRVPLPRTDEQGRPRRYVPTELMWLPSGERIAVVEWENGAAILRTEKPAAVTRAEQGGDLGQPPRQVSPATPFCPSLFVQLYKVSKVAPPDYDFPLTREALKGQKKLLEAIDLADAEDGGTRYLVALVKDLKIGQELAKHISSNVKSSTPQVFCGRPPKINRHLKVDWKSGALLP